MKKLIIFMISLSQTMAVLSQNTVYDALVKQTSKNSIYLNAIEQLDYKCFHSADFVKQIALLPSDQALLTFVDPSTFGAEETELWEFHLDSSKDPAQAIYADVYACKQNSDGTFSKTGEKKRQVTGGIGNQNISNRFYHIFRNSIITEPYVEGKRFYRTRANSFVCIEKKGSGMTVSAPLQANLGKPVASASTQTVSNGLVIMLNTPLQTTYNNVAKSLEKQEQFSEFFKVLKASGVLGLTSNDRTIAADALYGNLVIKSGSGSIQKCYPLLNSYHYTLYVPTNAAMQEAYSAGLPTVEELAAAEGDAEKTETITGILRDFVLYHIQEKALFVDKGAESGEYSSLVAKHFRRRLVSFSSTYGKPYKMKVDVDESSLTITDAQNNKIHVVTQTGLYNIMANEYWISRYNTNIDDESFVVIHAIDKPLLFSARQFTEDRTEGLKGDVNDDGKVDISDVVAVINQMAGQAFWKYADVNGDNQVDISDIVAIINIMASGN